MMQQDVAGSLRVSLKSSLSILSPMTGGFQLVDNSPRNWIPACAGMTENDAVTRLCRGFSGVSSEGEYKTRPYTGVVMTVQQNAAGVWGVPRFFTLPPRVGDQGG
jgi:hypothetical protein